MKSGHPSNALASRRSDVAHTRYQICNPTFCSPQALRMPEPYSVRGTGGSRMGIKYLKAVWVIAALGLVAVSGFAFLGASSDSTTIRFVASADSYVSSVYPTTVYGYGTSFWVSKTGTAENWGLVSFSVYSKLKSTDVIFIARFKLVV